MVKELDLLLMQCIREGCSDVHIVENEGVYVRCKRELIRSSFTSYSHEYIQSWLREKRGGQQQNDFSFFFQEQVHIRVHMHQTNGNISLALRIIPLKPPDVHHEYVQTFKETLLQAQYGLFLIVGTTGSGKTTTAVRCLLDVADECAIHMITLEDPIEYKMSSSKSLIQQKQVGRDVASLEEGIYRVLRQDPNYLFIGELRGNEAIRAALHAAQTGCVVVATIHAHSCIGSIERFSEAFSLRDEEYIHSKLASTIQCILHQQVIAGEQLQWKREVLTTSVPVRHCIAQQKWNELHHYVKR